MNTTGLQFINLIKKLYHPNIHQMDLPQGYWIN